MDGPTHYTMAEFLIEEAQSQLRAGDPDGQDGQDDRAASLIAIGQIHATLAVAAAAALGPSGADDRAWRDVADTKFSG